MEHFEPQDSYSEAIRKASFQYFSSVKIGQKWEKIPPLDPFEKDPGFWNLEILDIKDGFVQFKRDSDNELFQIDSLPIDSLKRIYRKVED